MTTTNKNIETKNLSTSIKTFWHDEEAATAVEYGLIAALIGAAIAAAVSALGTQLKTLFSYISTAISSKSA